MMSDEEANEAQIKVLMAVKELNDLVNEKMGGLTDEITMALLVYAGLVLGTRGPKHIPDEVLIDTINTGKHMAADGEKKGFIKHHTEKAIEDITVEKNGKKYDIQIMLTKAQLD